MPVTCEMIMKAMEDLAPLFLAEEWDNVGLLLGDSQREVRRVLLALDVTDDVVAEALQHDVHMIVTHHPFIFKPVRAVTSANAQGQRLLTLASRGICVYAAHTNLDMAVGGTNDVLFDALGLVHKAALGPLLFDTYALGRVGEVAEACLLCDFAERVKKALGLPCINMVGDADAMITRVGLCTGSCADVSYLEQAQKQGCHVYITGDLGFHNAQAALDMGLCVLDATHYASEVIVLPAVASFVQGWLEKQHMAVDIRISNTNGQVFAIL